MNHSELRQQGERTNVELQTTLYWACLALPARRLEKSKSEQSVTDQPLAFTKLNSLKEQYLPAEVELELLALKDVTIGATTLSWSGRDGSVQTTGLELRLEQRVDLGLLLALGESALDVGRLGLLSLLGRSSLLLGTGTLLGHGLGVVSLVPLTERSSINLNNAGLDDGVGADKLVVRGVVDDTNDASLAGRVLGCPGKVARLKTESAVLEVAAAGADGVDPLGSELGHGGLTTELELSLLAVVGTLGSLWSQSRKAMVSGTGLKLLQHAPSWRHVAYRGRALVARIPL